MIWDGKRDRLGASMTPCLGMVSLLAAVPKMSFQWVLQKKKCSKCLRFNGLGYMVPKPHRYTVNWEGSSGAMKSTLALKLMQYLNKLHNGLVNVTEIVTDDDSTMHAHCKHKNRGGKLTDNIPEPIFRANPSHFIKVMCKPSLPWYYDIIR